MRKRRYVTVGVNGSAPSDVAARFAAEEAALRGLTLLLVHAYEPHAGLADGPLLLQRASDAESILNSTWAQLDPPASLTVESRLYQGRPVDLLRDVQAESMLLVLGHRPPLELAAQAVTSRVLHDADCCVAVTPTLWWAPKSHAQVVAGVDPTRMNHAVLGAAFEEASLRRVGLAVLHVVDDDDVRAAISATTAESDADLRQWRTRYPEVPVHTTWQEGAPRDRLSRPMDAAVLVIGQHHRGHQPLRHPLVSSIVGQQMVPTIVVPAQNASFIG